MSKLTASDPVDQETLSMLDRLAQHQAEVSTRSMDLEMERIRLIRLYSTLDSDKKKLFGKILSDRGIAPDVDVIIDPKTGEITVDSPPPAA